MFQRSLTEKLIFHHRLEESWQAVWQSREKTFVIEQHMQRP